MLVILTGIGGPGPLQAALFPRQGVLLKGIKVGKSKNKTEQKPTSKQQCMSSFHSSIDCR